MAEHEDAVHVAYAMVAEFTRLCAQRDTPPHVIQAACRDIKQYLKMCSDNLESGVAPPKAINVENLTLEELSARHRQSLDAFCYWSTAYDTIADLSARVATHSVATAAANTEIRDIVKKYITVNNIYSQSPFNISQSLMKATIRKIWDTLYDIRTGVGHASPEGAIRDALVSKEVREIEYIRALIADIAASGETAGGFIGETADQMMQRLCPE